MARPATSPPTTPSSNGAPTLTPLGTYTGRPDLVLSRTVTTIGARKDVRLQLTSSTVSKIHALIINHNDGAYIKDLASRTHVLVNGQQVQEATLNEGDELQIGKFTFRFHAGIAPVRDGRAWDAPPIEYGPPPQALLRVEEADLPVPIESRAILIGRRAGSDVQLLEASASAAHAVIFVFNGQHVIRDLGSRTGTFVNGKKTSQTTLRLGDTIRIGETDMRYEGVAATAAAPAGLDEGPDELDEILGLAPAAKEPPREAPARERKRPAAPPILPDDLIPVETTSPAEPGEDDDFHALSAIDQELAIRGLETESGLEGLEDDEVAIEPEHPRPDDTHQLPAESAIAPVKPVMRLKRDVADGDNTSVSRTLSPDVEDERMQSRGGWRALQSEDTVLTESPQAPSDAAQSLVTQRTDDTEADAESNAPVDAAAPDAGAAIENEPTTISTETPEETAAVAEARDAAPAAVESVDVLDDADTGDASSAVEALIGDTDAPTESAGEDLASSELPPIPVEDDEVAPTPYDEVEPDVFELTPSPEVTLEEPETEARGDADAVISDDAPLVVEPVAEAPTPEPEAVAKVEEIAEVEIAPESEVSASETVELPAEPHEGELLDDHHDEAHDIFEADELHLEEPKPVEPLAAADVSVEIPEPIIESPPPLDLSGAPEPIRIEPVVPLGADALNLAPTEADDVEDALDVVEELESDDAADTMPPVAMSERAGPVADEATDAPDIEDLAGDVLLGPPETTEAAEVPVEEPDLPPIAAEAPAASDDETIPLAENLSAPIEESIVAAETETETDAPATEESGADELALAEDEPSEVLDRTEPSPESAFDLVAAESTDASAPGDEADDVALDEALTIDEPNEMTDSALGRDLEAFTGDSTGPLVESPRDASDADDASLADELTIEEDGEHASPDEPALPALDELSAETTDDLPAPIAADDDALDELIEPIADAGDEAPADAPTDENPSEDAPPAFRAQPTGSRRWGANQEHFLGGLPLQLSQSASPPPAPARRAMSAMKISFDPDSGPARPAAPAAPVVKPVKPIGFEGLSIGDDDDVVAPPMAPLKSMPITGTGTGAGATPITRNIESIPSVWNDAADPTDTVAGAPAPGPRERNVIASSPVPAAAAVPVEPLPSRSRKRRPGIRTLVVLMMLLAMVAAAVVFLTVPITGRIQGLLGFDRLGALSHTQRQAMLEEQRKLLLSEPVRTSAKAHLVEDSVAPGFLDDPATYNRMVREDVGWHEDGRSGLLVVRRGRIGDGDDLRVAALLKALYEANQPLTSEAQVLRAEVDAARNAHAQAQRTLADLEEQIVKAKAIADRRPAPADVEAQREELARLETAYEQAVAQSKRLEAELAQLRERMPENVQPAGVALGPAVATDPKLAELERERDALVKQIEEAHAMPAPDATEARKALDEALAAFEAQVNDARAKAGDDEAMQAYVSAAARFHGDLRAHAVETESDEPLQRVLDDWAGFQPTPESLPEDQRAIVTSLAERLDAIMTARRSYIDAANWSPDGASEAVARLEQRKTELDAQIEAGTAAMAAEQERMAQAQREQAQLAELKTAEDALAEANLAQTAAEEAWQGASKRLRELEGAIADAREAEEKLGLLNQRRTEAQEQLATHLKTLETKSARLDKSVEPIRPLKESVSLVEKDDRRGVYALGSVGAVVLVFTLLILWSASGNSPPAYTAGTPYPRPMPQPIPRAVENADDAATDENREEDDATKDQAIA